MNRRRFQRWCLACVVGSALVINLAFPAPTRIAASTQDAKTSVPQAPSPESGSQKKERTTTRRAIRIHVLGPDDKPMTGAKVHSSIWSKEPFSPNRDYVCDSQGLAIVELPRTLDILRIWASVDGYVPLFAHWEQDWQADGRLIPEEFTFKLTKGMVIGGFVKNEDGQPIQDARIEVILVNCKKPREPQNLPIANVWLAEGDAARLTDVEGRWTLDNVPSGDDVEVSLKLRHPDYISDLSLWGERPKMNVSTTLLRRQTATLVMARGITVTGSVVDSQGKPVVDAVLVWGDDPYTLQTSSGEVRTDARGMYRLPPLPPGPMTVTVMAKGWTPDLRKIIITKENSPVNFQLQPGKALRLRFVDESGKPVPEVCVRIQGWRGYKSLYNDKHSNVIDAKIPAKADKNGRYEWNWAPLDQVEYSFGKEGYQPIIEESLVADGVERQIKLSR